MPAAEPPRDLQILVVPYCHAGWAWTHTRHWHAERYALVFEETLALLRAQEAEGMSGDDPRAYPWYVDSYVTMLRPFQFGGGWKISERALRAFVNDQVRRCSFCGKEALQVRRLIADPNGAFICDACVARCNEVLARESAGQVAGGTG